MVSLPNQIVWYFLMVESHIGQHRLEIDTDFQLQLNIIFQVIVTVDKPSHASYALHLRAL